MGNLGTYAKKTELAYFTILFTNFFMFFLIVRSKCFVLVIVECK